MPEVSINIDVYCSSCGAGLCSDTNVVSGQYDRQSFHVNPCGNCLDEARNDGHAKGYEEGYNEAEKKHEEQ